MLLTEEYTINGNKHESTTFFEDFTIAERFGSVAIRDTFNQVHKEWKSNVHYYAEFVIALNHKIWQWYDKPGAKASILARLYDDLWRKADQYALDNFGEEDRRVYWDLTD